MSSDGNPLGTFNSRSSTSSPRRAGASSSSATSAANLTVRPRNRRLISFVEDGENEASGSAKGSVVQQGGLHPTTTGTISSSRNPSPSPYSSRATSPAPRNLFSRTPSALPGLGSFANGLGAGAGRASSQGKKSTGFAADLLDSSWSSIQGLASAVLGIDGNQSRNRSPLNGYRRRKSSESDSFAPVHDEGCRRPGLPSAWGPPGLNDTQILPGSKEDRQAVIQLKKRELLLQANGDAVPDSQGNYKRRISLDNSYSPSPARPVEQDDGDALVYVHVVQPTDSLTGVSIRYGCPLPILRKANGFWPSDSVQSRKVVVLPVASCTLKGRRISSDQVDQLNPKRGGSTDSLEDNSSLIPTPSPTNASGYGGSARGLDDPFSSSKLEKAPASTPMWRHESWVQVEGFPSPLELGRIPKRTLGFFARGRRQSQTLSEPYSHLDMSPSRSQTQRDLSHSPTSRLRDRSTSSSKVSPHPSRRSIVLSGPGGVGTLDRNAIGPGPAPDKLNAFVSTHLPNLVIPSQQPHMAGTSLGPNDRMSFDSASTSSTTGLENIGGAIEGWFRKVATKAKAGLNELQQPIQPHGHLGIGGNGDLIELSEAPESSRMTTPAPRQTGKTRRHAPFTSDMSNARSEERGRGMRLGDVDRKKGD
ncbi:uncharacterized protein CIMG_08689 [Coccidioides immitis RS]|uniref:LysM domain-containing protein n=4 Tax=Coccidioides immitis TaxID=5501 RepID=A0A0E1RX12_COCIM|nr:uncharacterized protein CIMG_08689 [Coccidioides immitis RS]KMP06928.1 hypothetical protein CIRG_06610 [Coccidioides immitis RMSCC 2394]KMU75185.1 hypothetical protein CISG_04133 [Coccidioides immitis RMSCC 3703]KMU92002.1 hypothetical protein CIHG_09773 [Coccidioides immitis H538.4]TPX22214.1 hypothetical protein DIZ76_014080 [Coccidioides immitis]EAS29943.1 hypothetical protein CIMG_08689 [Coccidioides immitis RS]